MRNKQRSCFDRTSLHKLRVFYRRATFCRRWLDFLCHGCARGPAAGRGGAGCGACDVTPTVAVSSESGRVARSLALRTPLTTVARAQRTRFYCSSIALTPSLHHRTNSWDSRALLTCCMDCVVTRKSCRRSNETSESYWIARKSRQWIAIRFGLNAA